MTRKEIEEQAMKLSVDDREVLAVILLHSLDDGTAERCVESIFAEWDRRFQDYKSRKTTAVPADEAFRRIRERHGFDQPRSGDSA